MNVYNIEIFFLERKIDGHSENFNNEIEKYKKAANRNYNLSEKYSRGVQQQNR